jgi:hypothetical protein
MYNGLLRNSKAIFACPNQGLFNHTLRDHAGSKNKCRKCISTIWFIFNLQSKINGQVFAQYIYIYVQRNVDYVITITYLDSMCGV